MKYLEICAETFMNKYLEALLEIELALKNEILEYLKTHPGALFNEIVQSLNVKGINTYSPKIAGYLEAMRDYGDIYIKPAGRAMRCYLKEA